MDTFTKQAAKFDQAAFGEGASAAEISRAVKELGVRLPRSYMEFLRELGYFQSPLLDVYGLGRRVPDHLSADGAALLP